MGFAAGLDRFLAVGAAGPAGAGAAMLGFEVAAVVSLLLSADMRSIVPPTVDGVEDCGRWGCCCVNIECGW